MSLPSQMNQNQAAQESRPGKAVLRVTEAKIIIIEFLDPENGKPIVKLASRFPDGSLYFLDNKAIGKPAQKWFSEEVTQKILANDPAPRDAESI